MPLPGVLLLSDAATLLQEDPERLRTSELVEVNIEPDALNYIAVLSAKGDTWLMLVDTDIAGDREVYFWPSLALNDESPSAAGADLSVGGNAVAINGDDARLAWGADRAVRK